MLPQEGVLAPIYKPSPARRIFSSGYRICTVGEGWPPAALAPGARRKQA
jgi:hypothetical protein